MTNTKEKTSMNSCTHVVSTVDLARVIRGMDYAIVQQSKESSKKVHVFTHVDGEDINTESASAWTVDTYRKLKSGQPNAIVYDCGTEGVEVVIKYPNGYGVHAISTPNISGGRMSLEVAVKCGRRVVFDTPVAMDLIQNVSMGELAVIMEHVKHLLPNGLDFEPGFTPLVKYDKRSVLREVYKWYKTAKQVLQK